MFLREELTTRNKIGEQYKILRENQFLEYYLPSKLKQVYKMDFVSERKINKKDQYIVVR